MVYVLLGVDYSAVRLGSARKASRGRVMSGRV